MKDANTSALVDLCIDIRWRKLDITHHERYIASPVNTYRDVFPGSCLEPVLNGIAGDMFPIRADPGQLIGDYSSRRVRKVPVSRLYTPVPMEQIRPGRFYPQGWLGGLPGIFRDNINPFRCLEIGGKTITADLNHPLAGVSMDISLTVLSRTGKSRERGGTCTDWMANALSGPGMQARSPGLATDFFHPGAFTRQDESPDDRFYSTDRLVHHIDRTARQNLSRIYGRIIRPGQRVLDLMAGWESHIPKGITPGYVHGIGMNAAEMGKNPVIDKYTVQDLNRNPGLEFSDCSFDAAVCSLSVEYLTDPVAVFREVARVLVPGGTFAVTFSNRWFPSKQIRIWEDLHEFERMGLVLELFIRSNRFGALTTASVRGYPRPEEDRYHAEYAWSDPVYAVSGRVLS